MPEENVAEAAVEETVPNPEATGEGTGEETSTGVPQFTPDELLSEVHRHVSQGEAVQDHGPSRAEIEAMERRLEETNRRLDSAIRPESKPERPDFDDPAVLHAILELPEEQRLTALNNLQRKRTEAEVGQVKSELEGEIGKLRESVQRTTQQQQIQTLINTTLDQMFPVVDDHTKAVINNWRAEAGESRLAKAFIKNPAAALTKGNIQNQVMAMGAGLRLLSDRMAQGQDPGQAVPASVQGADTTVSGGTPRTMDLSTDDGGKALTEAEKVLDRIADEEDEFSGASWMFNPV
jgi:hypothetical protein